MQVVQQLGAEGGMLPLQAPPSGGGGPASTVIVQMPERTSHVEPAGQVPQPLAPQEPLFGTHTLTWVPSNAVAGMQLSLPAQSPAPAHVFPQ
jgi:hypothetical protein